LNAKTNNKCINSFGNHETYDASDAAENSMFVCKLAQTSAPMIADQNEKLSRNPVRKNLSSKNYSQTHANSSSMKHSESSDGIIRLNHRSTLVGPRLKQRKPKIGNAQ